MHDPKEHTENGSGLSRRDFMKGTSAAAGAVGAVALPTLEAEGKPAGRVARLGPNATRISLTVNGQTMRTSVEPRVTLLDALRNYLDVTGCKRVCDRATCGACTVLLESKPIYACSMLAVEANGKTVNTAESLVTDGRLDRIPAAFVRHDAQQCGFCTPGFVVAINAVLDANPRATPQQVEEGLAGNICRCGTYEQMRDAIYDLLNRNRRT